jgi:hypothetical protein
MDRVASFELVEQRAGRLREVGWRFRELFPQKRRVDQAGVDLTPAPGANHVAENDSRAGFVAARLLGDEDAQVDSLSRLGDRRGRLR